LIWLACSPQSASKAMPKGWSTPVAWAASAMITTRPGPAWAEVVPVSLSRRRGLLRPGWQQLAPTSLLGKALAIVRAVECFRVMATLSESPSHKVLRLGNYACTVSMHSILCYWTRRELGISTLELAEKLQLAQSAMTQSVERGHKIVVEKQPLVYVDLK